MYTDYIGKLSFYSKKISLNFHPNNVYFNDANSLFISFHPASSATSDTHFWNVCLRLGDFSVVKEWNET